MSTDALKSALLTSTFDQVDDEKIAVHAEDVDNGSGIDFALHFFEPVAGSSYLFKLLPNPGGDYVTHRQAYKKLPDPERKGKTFHYISSGNAATCEALELFFDLYAKGKDGDAVAEKKWKNYLSSSREACVKIQVLQSPKQEEIGMIRLLRFHTTGPSTIIADLVNEKLNPSEAKIKQGFEREDIFDIFESSCLSVECTEKTFDGGIKGRDYSGSAWAPKKQGAIAILEDGKTHQFTPADKPNVETPEIAPFFEAFATELTNENYSTFKYFGYREPSDPKNSEEDKKYLEGVFKKVSEIIPVIRDKSLAEIAAYGKKEAAKTNGATSDDAKNVMAESMPDELAGSVMNQAATEGETVKEKTDAPAPDQNGQTNSDVNAVLNS